MTIKTNKIFTSELKSYHNENYLSSNLLDFLLSFNLILWKAPVELPSSYNSQSLKLLHPTFEKLISIYHNLSEKFINFFSIRIYYRYGQDIIYSKNYFPNKTLNSLKFTFSIPNCKHTLSIFSSTNLFHQKYALVLLNRYPQLSNLPPVKLFLKLGKIYQQIQYLSKSHTSFNIYQLVLHFLHFFDWKSFSVPLFPLIKFYLHRDNYQDNPEEFFNDLFQTSANPDEIQKILFDDSKNKIINVFPDGLIKVYPFRHNTIDISINYFANFFKGNIINLEKLCLTEPLLNLHLIGVKYYILELPPIPDFEKLHNIPHYIVDLMCFPDRTLIIGAVSTSKAHYIRRRFKKIHSITFSFSLGMYFLQNDFSSDIPKHSGHFPAFEKEFNFSSSHNYLKKILRKNKENFEEFKQLNKKTNFEDVDSSLDIKNNYFYSRHDNGIKKELSTRNNKFSKLFATIPANFFNSSKIETNLIYIGILDQKIKDYNPLVSIRDYIQIWGEIVTIIMAPNVLYAKISFSKEYSGFYQGLKQMLKKLNQKFIFEFNLTTPLAISNSNRYPKLFSDLYYVPPINFLDSYSYEYELPPPSIKKIKRILGI